MAALAGSRVLGAASGIGGFFAVVVPIGVCDEESLADGVVGAAILPVPALLSESEMAVVSLFKIGGCTFMSRTFA